MTTKYQILLAGLYPIRQRSLEKALFDAVDELGIARAQLEIIEENRGKLPSDKAPLVAVFFGYAPAKRPHKILSKLLRDSITIIPCVGRVSDVSEQLPQSIAHINAFQFTGSDHDYVRLATLILENLHLLRTERRLFISYKRSESQSIAIQLYETFDEAGFDVFLDTRSVPYGSDFQGVLWHRMADSDLIVLLDTPNFRASQWTQKELAQANATNIQILHLLWPSVRPDKSSAFSKFMLLESSNFKGLNRVGVEAQLTDSITRDIVSEAESLRARALAARHRSLVDNFCDQANNEGIKPIVQPDRFISVGLANGRKVAVVPTIGVPRADRYQELDATIRKTAPDAERVWLLYDERGILDSWLQHLDWLNSHLPVVSVKVSKCVEMLRNGAK